jgi:hypothetical protein
MCSDACVFIDVARCNVFYKLFIVSGHSTLDYMLLFFT